MLSVSGSNGAKRRVPFKGPPPGSIAYEDSAVREAPGSPADVLERPGGPSGSGRAGIGSVDPGDSSDGGHGELFDEGIPDSSDSGGEDGKPEPLTGFDWSAYDEDVADAVDAEDLIQEKGGSESDMDVDENWNDGEARSTGGEVFDMDVGETSESNSEQVRVSAIQGIQESTGVQGSRDTVGLERLGSATKERVGKSGDLVVSALKLNSAVAYPKRSFRVLPSGNFYANPRCVHTQLRSIWFSNICFAGLPGN
jgi:hypothetical protein